MDDSQRSTNGPIKCVSLKIAADVLHPNNGENINANDQLEMKNNQNEFELCQKKENITFLTVILHGKLIPFLSRSKYKNDITTHATENKSDQTRLYRKRILIQFLFSVLSMFNSVGWIQYSVLTNITVCYYDVTINAVNWMAMVYYVLSFFMMVPSAWFLESYGLRTTVLVGSSLTSFGVIIQCASLETNGYVVALVGQIMGALGESFILNVPPRLAATWFGPSEVSKSTAMGVFGNQLGTAVGFVFASYTIPSDCARKDLIRNGKALMTYSLVAINLFILLLIVLIFESKPRWPPSRAEAAKFDKSNFRESAVTLLKNGNFVLLCIGYGIVTGLVFAFSNILNQLVQPLFPNDEKEIGLMGFYNNLSGLFGIMIMGYFLDRTHKFKEIAMTILGGSVLAMSAFTELIYVKLIWVQYVINIILGFFLSSYLTVGFEISAEITYPVPEGTSGGFMIASLLGFAGVITVVGSYLIENHGNLACNMFFCVLLLLAFLLTGLSKCKPRRLIKNMEDPTSTIEDLSAENHGYSPSPDDWNEIHDFGNSSLKTS